MSLSNGFESEPEKKKKQPSKLNNRMGLSVFALSEYNVTRSPQFPITIFFFLTLWTITFQLQAEIIIISPPLPQLWGKEK